MILLYVWIGVDLNQSSLGQEVWPVKGPELALL